MMKGVLTGVGAGSVIVGANHLMGLSLSWWLEMAMAFALGAGWVLGDHIGRRMWKR